MTICGTPWELDDDNLLCFETFMNTLLETSEIVLVFNVPIFSIQNKSQLMEKILSQNTQRIRLNISYFFDPNVTLTESLKPLRNFFDTYTWNSTITLVFELRHLDLAQSFANKVTSQIQRPILFAPYELRGNPEKLESISTNDSLVLSQNWLIGVPNIEAMTRILYSRHIPCLSNQLLLDSNGRISNCKGYLLKGQSLPSNRTSFTEIESNWISQDSTVCSSCGLRAICYTCRIHVDNLSEGFIPCPRFMLDLISEAGNR
ncbi:MAG: hypothetical protein ACTSQE_17385, partial [Candidatus Heimdallarchaeaceae archaeon]